MANSFYIVSNESTNGRRQRIRSSLLNYSWSDELPTSHPGTDFGWITDFNKTLGVQSKTSSDFFLSWCSGLLQRELEELAYHNDIPVLLLENWPVIDRATGAAKNHYGLMMQGNRKIAYASFLHAFADCMASCPRLFPVISPDMQYTIEWLLHLGPEHFDKDENPAKEGWERSELIPRQKNKGMQFIAGLDGVGAELADRLWESFGTPFGVIDALRAGLWPRVIGVGRGMAQKALKQGNMQYTKKEEE